MWRHEKIEFAARQFEHNWQFNWCKNRRGREISDGGKPQNDGKLPGVSPLLIEIRVEIMVNLTF
jgi:hypothetical protein